MKLGLGIDTGGTYTDAVIYDFESNTIVKSAKSLTIKEDLTQGINNVISKIPGELLKDIRLVSLSTTLATNACVEGKGSRAVLILMGCDAETVRKYGHEYGLPDYREMIFIDGGHNQMGERICEPDWELLKKKVMECEYGTDSFGIVQLWGMRNPEFEKKAKELIRQWTGKPVVCGYELTAEINFLRRASSTLLNAQLIPLINGFIDAVKLSMKSNSIDAPLVIVRGDGSLMSEDFAREKPVETLLSGPSASIAGAMKLTGKKDCVIVDMGGTTSDLAVVKAGRPKLASEGAVVGNWRTGTKSISIETTGLGGDSMIGFDNNDELTIGPVRVAPLSWLANRWSYILDDLESMNIRKSKHSSSLCEFYYLIRDLPASGDFTEEEKRIVSALKNGPLSILKLSDAVGTSIYEIRLKSLEKYGIVMKSGLTPTDLLHLSGDYRVWSTEAARLGAEIMARRLNMKVDELIYKVNRKIKEKLYFNITRMLIENEDEYILSGKTSKQAEDLIMMGYNGKKAGRHISCSFSTGFDLVGIGAPIHIYLPDVAHALNTGCIIPEFAEVANAVGAITSNIMVEEEVIIKPHYEIAGIAGYSCHSPAEMKEFLKYEDALEWSRAEAEKTAREVALARGAGDIDITVDVVSSSINLPGSSSEEDSTDGVILLETKVKAYAVGTIKWL